MLSDPPRLHNNMRPARKQIGAHLPHAGTAGLDVVRADMYAAADLTVYFAATPNQLAPSPPLRRYIAQADLSGRILVCADAQWLVGL